jgi:hypothetical protein
VRKAPQKLTRKGEYSPIVRTDLSFGFGVFGWRSAKQTFPSLTSILPVSAIPHLVSFPTPGHGRLVCSVDAKLALSFL